ncbi:MAG: large subunit ribosomal protein L22 [Parcubacteria group bacterium Gr01-1014_38]|nr:MAG: large subunit ribosomal protein L22 [Parcubacteria group bacterium Gr01-1014_38]
MPVNAVLRFARIAPRKARLVADAIRGLPVAQAEVRLRMLEPRAAPLLAKLLKSAVANATQNFNLDPKELRVARVLVNEGPRLKRWMPRARGTANRIVKRTSHIEVVLAGPPGQEPTRARSAKPAIETKKAEELQPDELRAGTEPKRAGLGKAEGPGAVKPVEPPRGVRRLLERKHGSV